MKLNCLGILDYFKVYYFILSKRFFASYPLPKPLEAVLVIIMKIIDFFSWNQRRNIQVMSRYHYICLRTCLRLSKHILTIFRNNNNMMIFIKNDCENQSWTSRIFAMILNIPTYLQEESASHPSLLCRDAIGSSYGSFSIWVPMIFNDLSVGIYVISVRGREPLEHRTTSRSPWTWCEALSSRWGGRARLVRGGSSTSRSRWPFDPRYL